MSISDKEIENILKNNNIRKDTYKLIKNKDIIQDLATEYGNVLNRTTIIKYCMY